MHVHCGYTQYTWFSQSTEKALSTEKERVLQLSFLTITDFSANEFVVFDDVKQDDTTTPASKDIMY